MSKMGGDFERGRRRRRRRMTQRKRETREKTAEEDMMLISLGKSHIVYTKRLDTLVYNIVIC